MILNLYTIGQIFAQLWKCTVKFHTCKWVFHSAYVVKSYQLIGCRQRLIYYPFLNSIIFWLYCLPLVGVGRGRIAITHMNMIFFLKTHKWGIKSEMEDTMGQFYQPPDYTCRSQMMVYIQQECSIAQIMKGTDYPQSS